ncbi:MAG: MFS transporter [Dehalococcoidia bacterium]
MRHGLSRAWRRGPLAGLYYGWVIVGITACLQFAGGTPTFPVLGLFLEPMVDELGWTRSGYALPLTLGTILGGFAGAITGPAIDRYGARWIMTVAGIVVGGSFILTGLVHEYWQYFILQMVTRSVTVSTFFMVVGIVLPKWFVAQRGRAAAVSGLGGRAGQFFTPIIVGAVVLSMGWRSAWVGLGLMVWCIAVPPMLFLRGSPQEMGLLPDGARDERDAAPGVAGSGGARARSVEVSFTLRQALRTRSFYLMTIGQTTLALVVSGLHFHWFAYMSSRGLSGEVAVGSIAVSALAGIPSSLAVGYLAERVRVQHILIVTSLGFGASVIMLLFTSTPFMAYAYGVSLGVFSGVMFTVTLVIYADYFGAAHLGAIRGAVSPIQQITNASGPLVTAMAFDATGSYTAILWGFALLTTVTAFCWMAATPPARPAPEPPRT